MAAILIAIGLVGLFLYALSAFGARVTEIDAWIIRLIPQNYILWIGLGVFALGVIVAVLGW